MNPWNDPKNVERLKVLWTEGLSASQIASRMGQGVTRSSVCGKVRRLGLQDRKAKTCRPRKNMRAETAFGLPTATKQKRKGPPRDGVYVEPEIEPEDIPTKTFHELELRDGLCRHRIDVPLRNEPYGFCGKEALPGLSCCERHARKWFTNWPEVLSRSHMKAREKEGVPA